MRLAALHVAMLTLLAACVEPLPGADSIAGKPAASLPCATPCGLDEDCVAGACKPIGSCPVTCEESKGEYCDTTALPHACTPSACNIPEHFKSWLQLLVRLRPLEAPLGCDLNQDGKVDNALGAWLAAQGSVSHTISELWARHPPVVIVSLQPRGTLPMDASDVEIFGATILDKANCTLGTDGTPVRCPGDIPIAAYAPGPAADRCPSPWTVSATIDKSSIVQAVPSTVRLGRLHVPMGAGVDLRVSHASIRGAALFGAGKDGVDIWEQTDNAKLCAAIPRDDLVALFDALPGKRKVDLAAAGLKKPPPANDFDANGDGVPDSVSLAVRFTSRRPVN